MKKLIAGVFCLVVLLWGGSWYFLYARLPGLTERGQFGDMFGAANSHFSGLAFAGVVIAILLQRQELQQQREELKLQREELKLTREELQRSAAAQEKSEEALREQAIQMRKAAEFQAQATILNHIQANLPIGGPPSKEQHLYLNETRSAILDYCVDLLPTEVKEAIQRFSKSLKGVKPE